MFPNYEDLPNLDRIAKCIKFELSHGGNEIAAARAILRDIERGYILPHLTPYAVDLAICAPDLHALLDLQGFRFCGYCGNPLSH